MRTLAILSVSSLKQILPCSHYGHEFFLFFEVPIRYFSHWDCPKLSDHRYKFRKNPHPEVGRSRRSPPANSMPPRIRAAVAQYPDSATLPPPSCPGDMPETPARSLEKPYSFHQNSFNHKLLPQARLHRSQLHLNICTYCGFHDG